MDTWLRRLSLRCSTGICDMVRGCGANDVRRMAASAACSPRVASLTSRAKGMLPMPMAMAMSHCSHV